MPLIFLQTHIDYYQSPITDQPILHIFGTTKEGNPVQLHASGFLPYCYVPVPPNVPPRFIRDFETILSTQVSRGTLLRIEEEQHKSIYGYTPKPSSFYKLYFSNPLSLSGVTKVLEKGIYINGRRYCFQVYESNISFVLKFMVDKGITGMCYLKVKSYEEIDGGYTTHVDDITPLESKGEYCKLPPLKILSIDIECIGKNNTFPTAKSDPIIQIGNTLQYYNINEKNNLKKDIFTLRDCAPIPGANVHSFDTEVKLLDAWHNFIIKTDPDVIVGYNIKNFDLPYLLERADRLGLHEFALMARTNKKVVARSHFTSSRQQGARADKEVEIQGRLVLDMLQIIRREHKLRSYTLNAVSVHFLGEQKEDVPFYAMRALQDGDRDTRRRIATYCLTDTMLPLRLLAHLNTLVNLTEMARVTGVPVDYLSTRGQSIKVLSLIYRRARQEGYIIPVMEDGNDRTYEGGFVMDPLRGYYDTPIAVLDFSSLYPSIMIAKNICYTTLLKRKGSIKKEANKLNEESIKEDEYLKDDDILETPTKDYFVKKNVKEGLLPKILSDLLEERKRVKKELAQEKDELIKDTLQGRQLALKLAANSIYGFTGSTVGKLPCFEISQSVTGFGREMISETKRIIEETLNNPIIIKRILGDSIDNTPILDQDKKDTPIVKVVYGDTDSVMIDLNEPNLEKVFKISSIIAEYVSTHFIKPISLEFEKVYYPFLLLNKKRYAGLIYTSPNKKGRIDSKGIETVRRDNCGLVRSVVETCLERMLLFRDLESAKSHVRSVVRDLYLGRVDLSQLVISKALTKEGEKYQAKQAHVELAERLRKRDEGSAPVLGDRVGYVIVRGQKGSAAYERSEDPVYVLENGLPIDTEYYLENQLSKPIHRLFEPVMENVAELLRGEHTRVVSGASIMRGPMSQFMSRKTVCLGCKSPGDILCVSCQSDFPKIFLNLQDDMEEKKALFNKCWVECQRCMGSLHNEVLCVNRDCPIFYMRTKVKKELIELNEKFIKLNEW
ncbi:DNA polymerase delta catalytic subunit [Astathelohania contejeani]|uniref:DNA polymerase n=1 Tax=Astathelohania contejeani TaxID=164912 RepID=A0ABQ7I1D9_9MICR|nr:DNA polymerase delta catalytic subunit [Thelohania contejeani]